MKFSEFFSLCIGWAALILTSAAIGLGIGAAATPAPTLEPTADPSGIHAEPRQEAQR